MAYKSQELAFHLTRIGWRSEDVPLRHRVESWRLSIYQESSWSREQRSWRRIWHSSDWSEVELKRLRQSFPAPAKLN